MEYTCRFSVYPYTVLITTCGEMDITTVFGTVIPGSSPGGWTKYTKPTRKCWFCLYFTSRQDSKDGGRDSRLTKGKSWPSQGREPIFCLQNKDS
mgnify:CR=1 FL=1